VSEPAAGSRSLLCREGARLCAVPLAYVIETMRPLPLVALAGMPTFVSGMSVIRGVPTPVVSLGGLLGAVESPEPSRFVTVKTGPRTVALAVEEVVGVRDLSTAPLAELPPLLGEAAAAVVAAVGAVDAELLVVLRSARWVPAEVWQAIEAEGPAQ
jgi:purine-binding chemotaxis protein CheW